MPKTCKGLAGGHTVNITPPRPTQSYPGKVLRKAGPEEDSDILCHAVVFTDGDDIGAIVSIDVTAIDRATVLAIRESVLWAAPRETFCSYYSDCVHAIWGNVLAIRKGTLTIWENLLAIRTGCSCYLGKDPYYLGKLSCYSGKCSPGPGLGKYSVLTI